MTLERPMFPPSRRGFLGLAGAAVASLATSQTIAAPTRPHALRRAPVASQALRAAIARLDAAKATLDAAKAHTDERLRLVGAWEARHPRPTSRRGQRRWRRQAEAYRFEVVTPAWNDQMVAENAFRSTQSAVAAIAPMNRDDLIAKAHCSAMFDPVELAGPQSAAIGLSVAVSIASQAANASFGEVL